MRYDKRNEVYYWIKIRNNLMYSTEMKLLMRQHDGGWYFSIYIYLIMLSINSGGRLIQKVGDVEMVYDLTMITQELMFFKIDTIRVAIEMLKDLKFLYTDEKNVLCISNFDSLVGQETGWAEHKKKQRETKLLKSVDNVPANVPTNVHADVHANVPPESRYQSIEYRDKNIEKEINAINAINALNDVNDINNRVTLPSDSEIIDKFKNLEENEWITEFINAHIFTKYFVHSKYIEYGDINSILAANGFFESYLKTTYTFEEMKSHVQYFLMQYRKKPQKDKDKITNKIGYFTNAVKGNQRRREWNRSKEFIEMQKVHETVAEELKAEALKLFPNDEMRQNMFVDEYYLPELGNAMRRIRRDFDRKSTVV